MWSKATLGEICDVNIGRTPARNRPDFWGLGHPWLSIADMKQGRTLRTTKESITDTAVNNCNCKWVEKGTVLLSFKLSIGKVGITELPMFTNEAIASLPIQDRKRLCTEFLYWVLQSIDLTLGLDRAAKGLTLNKAKLLKIEIPIPPLPEQKRIAAVLDKADELRAKRRAALYKLDTLTQSIFLEMFGDPDSIFTNWPTKKLGELLDFLTSGSRGWATHYADSGDLFLRIQNVRYDELILDDVAYVNAPNSAEAKRTRVESGDVLLSITADLGRTAVIPEDIGKAYINQHLSILRTKSIMPKFLSAYLASPAGQRQVSGRNKHAVKAGLNFDDIRSFIIPLPPLPLQREFASRITLVEKLKSSHRASLEKLDALFASFQDRAFKGEL